MSSSLHDSPDGPRRNKRGHGDADADPWITTVSIPFQGALSQLRDLAQSRTVPIVLEGETGTGKSHMAQYVHKWSLRSDGPFQILPLAALDDSLAGSALFGHVVGAFADAKAARRGLFASSHNGTLFLDELGKCSLAIQYKLLEVIETGEFMPLGSDHAVQVDVRVIAASNVSLSALVEAGAFLPDLLARLQAYQVRLPPLRERRGDIPVLVRAIVADHANDCGYRDPPDVDGDLLVALLHAPWPNNLRQLDSTLHRIMLTARRAKILTLDHCRDTFEDLVTLGRGNSPLTQARILEAVKRTGSVAAAARELGASRSTVYRHMHDGPSQELSHEQSPPCTE